MNVRMLTLLIAICVLAGVPLGASPERSQVKTKIKGNRPLSPWTRRLCFESM